MLELRYVVEYMRNESNRGVSDLQRKLGDLQNEYPDEQDYTELIKRLGMRLFDNVEMTAHEGSWYTSFAANP